MDGGDGEDTVDGGTGEDTADGSAPAGAAAVILDPNPGAPDAVDEVTNGEDTVNGGDGEDTVDGPQVVGSDGNDVIVTGFASEGVVNTPDDASGTTNDADSVSGAGGNDTIAAGGGDDTVDGGAGNDAVLGDVGNDDLAGAEGDDVLIGGEGDDTLEGGAGADEVTGGAGIDRFVFDPSDVAEGDDIVTDFAVGEDLISLRAADILNASPDLSELSPEALDLSEDWSIAGSDDVARGDGEDTVDGGTGDDTVGGGDVVITHPGGTITLDGIAFGEGTDSFVELADAGALEIAGLVVGTDESEDLPGTDDDDVIDALAGDDTLTGGSGDDILNGGAGGDDFAFDPSNEDEGDDTVLDFTFQVVTDVAERDYIALSSEQVLAADPDLPAANNGDPDNPDDDENLLTLADFDASANWDLGASEDGWLSITHPNGTIELVGILPTADASFNDLAPVIKVDNELFPEEGIALSGETPEEPTDPEVAGEPTDPEAPDEPVDPALEDEPDALLI